MLALVIVLAAVLVLTPTALANVYTVWSSVVLTRTGERTPEILGSLPVELTSLGAQQAYAAGSFFRNRYITLNSTSNGSVAPIQDLSPDTLSNLQLYAIALDYQWTSATAQAFLQGLYPPYTLNSADVASGRAMLDPTNILASDVYVDAPLQGYQYAQIHSLGSQDPNFIYLSANLYCPAFDTASVTYYDTDEFAVTQNISKGVYDAIGGAVLGDILEPVAWDYYNAYAIFDYLNYQNVHNSTIADILKSYQQAYTNTSYLDMLRWLADEQQYAMLGDLHAHNTVTGGSRPGAAQGSISTIAGNMLAAKILGQLENAIKYGGEFFKLNLLFADYAPFLSFFALANLPNAHSNFYGLPDFAASMVFELFSYTNGSADAPFPDPEDLWVRFYFRNGTEDGDRYQAFSLFNRGPDGMDMTWAEFQTDMYSIIVSDVGDWCLQCGAYNAFCAAYNGSATGGLILGGSGVPASSGSKSDSANGRHLSPAIGGVIGAVVTLAVAALIFGGAMLFGGVRMQRVHTSRKGEMGGFRGGNKMRSDQDLTLPKGGAVVGSTVERSERDSPVSPIEGGHERAGSWEMKQAHDARQDVADAQSVRMPSFDEERGPDPFGDPVKAREGV